MCHWLMGKGELISIDEILRFLFLLFDMRMAVVHNISIVRPGHVRKHCCTVIIGIIIDISGLAGLLVELSSKL